MAEGKVKSLKIIGLRPEMLFDSLRLVRPEITCLTENLRRTKTRKTPSVGFTLLSSFYAKCHTFVF